MSRVQQARGEAKEKKALKATQDDSSFESSEDGISKAMKHINFLALDGEL